MTVFDVSGLGSCHVPYEEALQRQRAVHAEVASGTAPDTILLLEHESVFTAGKRTSPDERPTDGTPVIDVDRGGKITWHGPGQLVGYPILRLAEPIDVVGYVRWLEDVLIGVLRGLGVSGERVDGRSGVWLRGDTTTDGDARDKKIAAIGIRVAEGVTMHGFALNCSNGLDAYDTIVACGIRDAGVTTISRALGRTVTPAEVAPLVRDALDRALADPSSSPVAAAARTEGTASGGCRVSAPVEGRKLLRLEVRNAQTPIERKPAWIKTKAKMGPEYRQLQNLVKSEALHTVCQEAGCPNIYECWEDREATFLIGGSQCTRRCDFCQIDTGKPAEFDRDEPRRVAESVARMGLRYSTVTGVARDDLEDEGSWLYAETIREIHRQSPGTGVEILVPDFSGNPEYLGEVFSAQPEVFAHNVETVPRIFKRIRPAFRYERSLDVIAQGRAAGLITKSNLILGMGEERAEISQALHDLHDAGTDIITITQYLRPSPRHLPVARWVHPDEFVELKQEAEEIGFLGVLSGPLVRSSYRAGRLWAQSMQAKGRPVPTELQHLADASAGFAQALS